MTERELCSRCGFADPEKTATALYDYFHSHGMDDAAALMRELEASIRALRARQMPFGV